ncbi:hypothetical protein ACFQL4_22080 [Halosimplex aquaticum]
MAAGADYQYEQTDGSPSLGTKLFNWYFTRLLKQAHDDGVVAEAYGEVVGLERSPTALLSPRVLARVLLPVGGDWVDTDPGRRTRVPSGSDGSARDDERAVEPPSP